MKSIGSSGWWMGAIALSASLAHAEPGFPNAEATSPRAVSSAVVGAVAGTISETITPVTPIAPITPITPITPIALVDFRGEPASSEARATARNAFERADAKGRPFAVVDKKDAKLYVFTADGRLAGAAPALLGLARGDRVAAGVGEMVATGIPAALRTTPAGRYDSQPGPNLKGETVIWVDYDAAFAIHRLRPSPAHERRAERLASPSPDDNRISLGCVVVTAEFFDRVVAPVLGHGAGVVYVLPEPAPAPLALGVSR